ncbi:PAS domain-containing protein [Pelagibacterium xiamenense]|uniref:PAS domain-containing protein n=1 Tax=Pelagibacterium xiamenense TaxID=2901140 RepID=UPI001E46C66E|nr:PAS domain-containing protein [Pelagibacterium xiamenense]MCD7059911.1 PAS domain-containing protein [Pelagibacterium xiamenense]
MQQASTRTLYAYWNEIRGARSAPERRDIDPTRIRDALAYTFILESADGVEFDFRLAGSHLCASYCRELKARPFSALWGAKDRDAIDTLMRAVTEDHAVALVTYEGQSDRGEKLSFELALFPLRHNGVTTARVMGGLTALDTPYWLGIHPITSQRITALRLIWPDDRDTRAGAPYSDAAFGEMAATVRQARTETEAAHAPLQATVAGLSARRYAHLAVIDGGKN